MGGAGKPYVIMNEDATLAQLVEHLFVMRGLRRIRRCQLYFSRSQQPRNPLLQHSRGFYPHR